jgi:hypothetical protein
LHSNKYGNNHVPGQQSRPYVHSAELQFQACIQFQVSSLQGSRTQSSITYMYKLKNKVISGNMIQSVYLSCSGVPRIFFGGGSTNSVEDRGQRERGSRGDSPLVRGSAKFANE